MRITHKERAVRRKKLAECVQNGGEPYAVAVKFGVTVDTVKNACIEHGVPFSITKIKTRTRVYEILADLLNTRLSVPEIAEKHGAGRSHVYSVIRSATRAGIDIPPREKET